MNAAQRQLVRFKKISKAKDAAMQRSLRDFSRSQTLYEELAERAAELRQLIDSYDAEARKLPPGQRAEQLSMRQRFLTQLCDVHKQQQQAVQQQMQVTAEARQRYLSRYRDQKLFNDFIAKREHRLDREKLKREEKQQVRRSLSML